MVPKKQIFDQQKFIPIQEKGALKKFKSKDVHQWENDHCLLCLWLGNIIPHRVFLLLFLQRVCFLLLLVHWHQKPNRGDDDSLQSLLCCKWSLCFFGTIHSTNHLIKRHLGKMPLKKLNSLSLAIQSVDVGIFFSWRT